MSFRDSRAGGSVAKRVFLLTGLLVLGGLGWWGFISLGWILHHEDPLERADVIFVLGGTRLERAAEAGELFLEGWAPRILLSRQESDGAEVALQRRGLNVPTENALQIETLVQMGVPREAIETIDEEQGATAAESRELLEQAETHAWHSIIIVTSKLHTARARLAFARRFDGTVRIIMRASRYDPYDVERWWASRGSFRFVLFESQKMLAYWIGLAD